MKKCIIVTYHYVLDKNHPYPGLKGLSLEGFTKQIDFLNKNYQIISLSDYAEYLHGEGDIPDKSVCLTFDDGLLDHYINVCPVLKKRGLPATFFVMSNPVKNLELTDVHKLHVLMMRFEAEQIFDWLKKYVDDLAEYMRVSTIFSEEAEERYSLASKEGARLKYLFNRILPIKLRGEILDNLMKQADINQKELVESFYLSEDHVKKMSDRGFTIGSHTVTHQRLSSLSYDEKVRELTESKEYLEEITGRPIYHFSYPFGKEQDFDKESIEILKELGYKSAMTTINEVNEGKVDPYTIRRIDTLRIPFE